MSVVCHLNRCPPLPRHLGAQPLRCLSSITGNLQNHMKAASSRAFVASLSDPEPEPEPEEEVPVDVTLGDISRADYLIRGGILNSPCRFSPKLSQMLGMNVHLKLDHYQITGSFKERGARNSLIQLSEEQKSVGVIAASAGNHALALGYHGRDLNIPVTCVMPRFAPLTKINNCKEYGAEVILHGDHIGEAKELALELAAKNGKEYINGYDHPHIIAGAGTMGLEMLNQVPDADAIVIPVGGAGLIAGVAAACKTIKPKIEIIGVEPMNCASLMEALKAGRVVDAAFKPTLADGLAVPRVGNNAFHISKRYVDRCVLVDESEIALAVLRMVEMEKTVVEGGAAAGIAGLLSGQLQHLQGKTVVVAVCGGNIDTPMLGRVIQRGLAADNRLIRFVATISDRPGGLNHFTDHLAKLGASIHDIEHERAWMQTSMTDVQIRCVVEVTGKEHKEELVQGMKQVGYDLTLTKKPGDEFIEQAGPLNSGAMRL